MRQNIKIHSIWKESGSKSLFPAGETVLIQLMHPESQLKSFNPLVPSVLNIGLLAKILISIWEGILKKKILWASHLWVGRRKEPNISHATKNDEKKKIQAQMGLLLSD